MQYEGYRTCANDKVCENLVLREKKSGISKGEIFWGCKLYPDCHQVISCDLDVNKLTKDQKKLMSCLRAFINSNNFLTATYSSVYYNLSSPSALDYVLKSDTIKEGLEKIEIGFTNAKIYYTLFYHIYLIPNNIIKLYLKTNFPFSYKRFLNNEKPKLFTFIDYQQNSVDEKVILPFKEVYVSYPEIEILN